MRSSVPTASPGQRTGGLEKWLLRAAGAGDAGSQYNLGILCDNGMDDNGHAVAGNRRQAVKWLLAAAEQGLPRAQVKLAEVYADAPDISGSHAAAGGWFLLAALGLHGVHLHRARSGYERIALHLNSDSPDEMAFGQLRAPISDAKSNSYAGSSSRIPTDPTGERRNWQFRQRFRGLRSCRPNPSGESGPISPQSRYKGDTLLHPRVVPGGQRGLVQPP